MKPVAGVVLAAGLSRRFQGNKLLGLVAGQPMICRVVAAALGSRLNPVVVVLGHESELLRAALAPFADPRLHIVQNPRFAEGQSTTVVAGLRALPEDCPAAMFLMGDQPLIEPAIIDRLIESHALDAICHPMVAGRLRNPVIFARRFFPDILALAGDSGARAVIAANPEAVGTVEFDREGPFMDVDSNAELERLAPPISPLVLIKGAGEMASAVAWRLWQARLRRICMLELEKPLAVRRAVSFCSALEGGTTVVEGVSARLVEDAAGVRDCWAAGEIALALSRRWPAFGFSPDVVVDAILAKRNLGTGLDEAPLVVALGPGFEAGRDCHIVVETNRGHDLGRLIETGSAEPNTGVPGAIAGHQAERVLRAPAAGVFTSDHAIGDQVAAGETVGEIAGQPVVAELDGVLRGLLRPGTEIAAGRKLGDIDPRGRAEYCTTISDKARAIAGSVLEAVMRQANRGATNRGLEG
ncbi:MAG TPA: selenium-dependent molybdenum cofactor biosynthesis protein YqeB [Alphaproteobacteria bacterium]|nr:selenium-dependent molybdenum cofactor biosynthesis protein YqeB [Alphaproteobacteria bacterium]